MSNDQFPGPTSGSPITMGSNGKLTVPNDPIIPFIEGDGTGRDIWAPRCACSMPPSRRLQRSEEDRLVGVYAAKRLSAVNNWLPDQTVEGFRKYSSASRAR